MLIYHPPTWSLPEKEVQLGVVTRTKSKIGAVVKHKDTRLFKSSAAPLYRSVVNLLHGNIRESLIGLLPQPIPNHPNACLHKKTYLCTLTQGLYLRVLMIHLSLSFTTRTD